MIGNDIIDLGDIRTHKVHDRSDARIFTAAELEAIDRAPDRRRARWRYWAAKEAAYKALRDPGVKFTPSAFEFDALASVVRWEGRSLRASVEAAKDFVHVTVGDAWYAVARRSSDDRAADVRELVSGAVGDGFEDLCYFDGKLPTMLLGGEALPVSISHHGRFVAAAFPWSAFQMAG